MIIVKNSRVDKFCTKCGREIKLGEKYYCTGKSRTGTRALKGLGIRIFCVDCIDKIYVDA